MPQVAVAPLPVSLLVAALAVFASYGEDATGEAAIRDDAAVHAVSYRVARTTLCELPGGSPETVSRAVDVADYASNSPRSVITARPPNSTREPETRTSTSPPRREAWNARMAFLPRRGAQ